MRDCASGNDGCVENRNLSEQLKRLRRSLSAVSMIMMVVPIMTVIPIATNPEDAIDGAHRAADTGADRAANDGAHRACRTATLARAVLCAPLHAADDALRMAGMGHREQRESECCGCKREPEG
jgi:hypothetical protein